MGGGCRAHGTAAALRHVASLGCVWVSHRHAGEGGRRCLPPRNALLLSAHPASSSGSRAAPLCSLLTLSICQPALSKGPVACPHLLADHMSGVLPLLAAYPASLPPLLVVGPRSLRDWLAEAAPPLGLARRYLFVHCLELNQPGEGGRRSLGQADKG